MTQVEFRISDWIGQAGYGPGDDTFLGMLAIQAGQPGNWLTEAEDTFARTVRPDIRVSLDQVSRWLLANWWRLRWESRPQPLTVEWRSVHSMAALGGGFAWPDIDFSGQGDFVEIQMTGETVADSAAIRYLRNAKLLVPSRDFEAAVDAFVATVGERSRACGVRTSELEELRREVYEERSDPKLANRCRMQAIAGVDPGAASAPWLKAAEELILRAGPEAADEVLAVLPGLGGDLEAAHAQVSAVQSAATKVRLGWLQAVPKMKAAPEVPWKTGARLARQVRQTLGLKSGPVSTAVLGNALGATLPLPVEALAKRAIVQGGYRDASSGVTSVLMNRRHPHGQRFHLARLIGCAAASPAEQSLLPITSAETALQKVERSFAQEFLCPWSELDAFTDEHGVDEQGIAEAADYFDVSERVIQSTLVNKQKLERDALPQG